MDAPSDAPLARASAWPGHLARLRWFAAEFVVVVAGVLVALAVSSWAQERRDHGREEAYLRQLSADLAANVEGLERAVGIHRERAEAAARVVQRFWQESPTVDDTLVHDLILPRSNARYRPILGTAEALISTGDLNLIRSDALRTAILAYVEGVNFKLSDIQRYEETYYRPAMDMVFRGPDVLPYARPRSTDYAVAARPEKVERVPFPTSLADIVRDRTVYQAYTQLLIAHRNPSARYAELLEESRTLKAQVDAAIKR